MVALVVGLFRGPEFLRAGGDEVADETVRLDGDILMGTGCTAAAGLMTASWEW